MSQHKYVSHKILCGLKFLKNTKTLTTLYDPQVILRCAIVFSSWSQYNSTSKYIDVDENVGLMCS
jgi:hypothetical protein